MLATLIPLFDNKMEVCAYSVFAQRENYLMHPSLLGTGSLDAAAGLLGLEIIESMGIGTLAGDKEVFIEVNNISLFSDIENQCSAPASKVVLLIDYKINTEQMYVDRITDLKSKGYKFAVRKLKIEQFEEYKAVLSLMDYILLDHKKIKIEKAKIYFGQVYPNIKLCAVNVDTKEEYEKLTESDGYHLFEGDFFRMPAISKTGEIAPLKITYIELLNLVNQPDFDLTEVADVISKDTALVINMLEIVNKLSRNSKITSIRAATAMLGQREIRRWASTAATKSLCADKPSEIMRLSLIRAKFAENLAYCFDLGAVTAELFLMGLFSVLDILLDKNMKDALELVNVSEEISSALLERKGRLAPLLNFMLYYEDADWQEVSRLMTVLNIDVKNVYIAYTDALIWYRDMFL